MKIVLSELGYGKILDDNGKDLSQQLSVSKVEIGTIVPGKPVSVKLTVDFPELDIDCNCKQVEIVKQEGS